MQGKIKFGTDGWRAIIAEDFTFANVRACAQGVADFLKQTGKDRQGLVIGNDTRFASDEFAQACAEVIAGNSIKVLLCNGTAPTPVISYTVVNTKSAGAIIITASHNPAQWNGFKYKDETGASAPTTIVSQIENYTNTAAISKNFKHISLEQGLKSGKIVWYDPVPQYKIQVQKLVNLEEIRQSRLKIILDPMYGAGIGYFKTLLEGGKIKTDEIHSERNPLFPGLHPEPIARNLTQLCGQVKIQKASVGLATDGDADRIGIVTEKGEWLNPHEVFSLLALYFLEVKGERRPIIRSLCSSNMLDLLGERYNVPVYVTKVGFKYVAPLMLEKDAFIGGEESGGYGFRGHVPERDGILAGLLFLDFMIRLGKSPSELLEYLFSIVGQHYYDRIDVHMNPELQQKIHKQLQLCVSTDSIIGIKVTNLDRTDGYKFNLEDNSWLLIRSSGTEPLIRIYAESNSKEQVQQMLQAGKVLVGM